MAKFTGRSKCRLDWPHLPAVMGCAGQVYAVHPRVNEMRQKFQGYGFQFRKPRREGDGPLKLV
jgi:hypothetical protein